MGLLLGVVLSALPVRAEKPRVVSLDYCADQFVLGLADREQILAVSKDAEKPFSFLRARAAGIPKVRAAAEDVIALKPDLVVRSWGGDARALAFYERFGIHTVQIGYATDFEGAAQVTREIGASLDQAARAEGLVEHMPPPAAPLGLKAAYMTPSGVSAGTGTMVDTILSAAGLENAADRPGWHSVGLERLVVAPPALAVTAFFGFDTDTGDQWSAARHPVLRKILQHAEQVELDESRLTCPAWFVADEAADLNRQVKGRNR
ncbi:MAG: ABC transporter substrate-binding protein [Hyphomonas sp.]|uniref:ABC transporter substrate-binding protein n=1 Tax=Hyphomonas sp. TaxID=87 RepID=UPI0035283BA2